MSVWHRVLFVLSLLISSGLTAITADAGSIPQRNLSHLFDILTVDGTALVLPTDVEVDNARIYIVDSGNNRIVVLDSNGRALLAFGKAGSAAGELQDPVGLGVGRDGRIYVADSGNNRIQIFDSNGSVAGQIRLTSANQPIRPIDVAVDDRTGHLYITGNNNHKLMVYDQQGRKLREWGGNGAETGQFRYPATVALTDDARIAVVDVLNTRIQLFQPDGRFLVNIGDWGVLPGQLFRPKGVAIDSQNRIYVSDSYMNLIQVFNDSGQFLHVLKMQGKRTALTTPTGIAVSGKRLYVTEMLKHRISVLRLE